MKITYATQTAACLVTVAQMERGHCYVQEGRTDRIVLRTDEGSVVSLGSGVLFADDHFGNDIKFRKVAAEVVIR